MKRLGLLAAAAIGLSGCAEPLHLVERGSTPSDYSFWPPPPSSDLWLPPPASARGSSRLGAVASELDASLVSAGFSDSRWYPIGSEYQHGFVLTTRLEQLEGSPGQAVERWPSTYPDPVSLTWLNIAQAPKVPRPGRYRAFLIAFTDLPLQSGSSPPYWNEHTLMDGPGAPDRRRIARKAQERRVTSQYRFGVYEYLYDWDAEHQRGALRVADDEAPVRSWPPVLGGRAQ